jgi:hypothetical protein
VVGLFDQRFDRQAHGAVACAQNVDPIDLDGINNTDSPSDFGIRDQIAINLFAQFRPELFGIVQAAMTEFFRENHRGCDNWTCQRTAAGFINPRNAHNSDGTEFFLVTKAAPPVGHRRKPSTDLREVTSDE